MFFEEVGMSVTILNGDCRELLATLPSFAFDCVLTDPPYGETSLAWDDRVSSWPSMVHRLVKPTGSMWVFGSLRMFMEEASSFVESGWILSHEVVWEKHNGSGMFNDRFRRVHEIAVHFYKRGTKWGDVFKSPQFTNDATARTVRKKGRPAQWIGATGETVYRSEDGGPRLMRSVQFVRSEHGRAEHPTQKPLGIIQPLLRYACPVGGTVLDPFAGSGTTGLAAKLNGMSATLIEISSNYTDVARRRLEGDAPLFAEVNA
jgi:site-specific DNA-methyltransferase (adenine-specific)